MRLWTLPRVAALFLAALLLCPIGLAMTVGPVGAQDPLSELDAAEGLWASRPSDSHIFSYSYFTGGAALFGTTTVVDGVNQNPGAGTLTVEDIFSEIRGQLAGGGTPEGLSFDSEYGVPLGFSFGNTSFYSLDAFRFFDPVESSELEAAIDTWEARQSNRYTISYRYCLGFTGCQEQELQFADGQLIAGLDLDGDTANPFLTLDVDDLHIDMEEALSAGVFMAEGSYDNNGVPTSYFIDLFPGAGGDTVSFELLDFRFDADEVNLLTPTVTCLAGNGRIDVNIVNDGDAAATYQLQIGSLPIRQSTVAPKSWWRSPVTGRPDGFISVVVRRDGLTVLNETVLVRCDGPFPGVSQPEVEFLTWCIGGNGIIFAQMANDTDSSRAYILDVEGIRRSTTAAAYGAAFRGISGRPDGSYNAIVYNGNRVVSSATVEVNC